MERKFQSGCWSYFEDRMLIAFNPEINDPRPEIPIYGVQLDTLTTSAKLLDTILQMQQKGRWSTKGKERQNNYGRWHCDDYQIWDFIQVMDSICRHRMNKSIQGVFSAWGEEFEIDWDKLSQEKLAEKAELHPVYIGKIERGEQWISLHALLRIAKALGIRVRDLVADI
jgi:DNA-binding XRE family transcriptional regulator